jgi:hypothetical protein
MTCSIDKCCENVYVALIYGHTRRDRVQNDDIHDRLGVAPIENKLVQH